MAVGVPFLFKGSETIWWLSESVYSSAVWSGCSMWVFVLEAQAERMEVGEGKRRGRPKEKELCTQINPVGSGLWASESALSFSSPSFSTAVFISPPLQMFNSLQQLRFNWKVKRQKKVVVYEQGQKKEKKSTTMFCLHGWWERVLCAADEECGWQNESEKHISKRPFSSPVSKPHCFMYSAVCHGRGGETKKREKLEKPLSFLQTWNFCSQPNKWLLSPLSLSTRNRKLGVQRAIIWYLLMTFWHQQTPRVTTSYYSASHKHRQTSIRMITGLLTTLDHIPFLLTVTKQILTLHFICMLSIFHI